MDSEHSPEHEVGCSCHSQSVYKSLENSKNNGNLQFYSPEHEVGCSCHSQSVYKSLENSKNNVSSGALSETALEYLDLLLFTVNSISTTKSTNGNGLDKFTNGLDPERTDYGIKRNSLVLAFETLPPVQRSVVKNPVLELKNFKTELMLMYPQHNFMLQLNQNLKYLIQRLNLNIRKFYYRQQKMKLSLIELIIIPLTILTGMNGSSPFQRLRFLKLIK